MDISGFRISVYPDIIVYKPIVLEVCIKCTTENDGSHWTVQVDVLIVVMVAC